MIILKTDKQHNLYGKCCYATSEPMPTTDEGKVDTEKVKSIIGCDTFDIVSIGHGIDMWVDDEGLYTQKGNYNWPATALRIAYFMQNRDEIVCPVNYPPIMGNVCLLACDDNGNTIDLNVDQITYVKSIFGRVD